MKEKGYLQYVLHTIYLVLDIKTNLIIVIKEFLKRTFEVFNTENLKGVSKKQFKNYIESRIGIIDAQNEGYSVEELNYQRDLSVKFHWGHNHNFGDFQIDGRMHERHIELVNNFIKLFPVSISDFKDKDIFDIGCWTGGTTLLIAALGNRVLAIEEVNKYAETVSFLIKSFGLTDTVQIEPKSLFQCNTEDYYDKFDMVFFPGVLYHLSDPVLALRILFNSLKPGGNILIESAGINHPDPICRFEGSLIHHKGTKENLNRGGWNWFKPSPVALSRMMKEAGFEEIETLWHEETKRLYGYGKKIKQKGMCKAGLSIPSIR